MSSESSTDECELAISNFDDQNVTVQGIKVSIVSVEMIKINSRLSFLNGPSSYVLYAGFYMQILRS